MCIHQYLQFSSVAHLKKLSNNMTIRHSYATVKPRTARLNPFPDNIWSTVLEAYTPESASMSRKPPEAQILPIDAIKHDKAWNPPSLITCELNSSGIDHLLAGLLHIIADQTSELKMVDLPSSPCLNIVSWRCKLLPYH